ncbi:MAG TPA: patatin-like phospholipase family protein [Spirochaetota bacterium]|nr:patatin-like phospholipase family protein [Spirochaetota bacterium]
MKKLKVLSIDGGGIRGIIPAVVLTQLEKKIQNKTGDPSARLSDYFDLIVGSSVGGLITSLLLLPDKDNRPVYSASDILELFLTRGKDIFKRDPLQSFKSFFTLCDELYSDKFFNSILNEYLGSTKLLALLKPALITAYDIERRKPIFFRSHRAKHDRDYDFYLKDVVRSTTAAPTYFEPALIKSMSNNYYALIDGGIFANNPAMCGYVEALEQGSLLPCIPSPENILFLSIGTGITSKAYLYKQFKNAGLTKWAKPLIEIIMTSSEETAHYQLTHIFKSHGFPENYLRINIPLNSYDEKTFLMDNVKPENINLLRNIGSECALLFDEELEKFGENIIYKSPETSLLI